MKRKRNTGVVLGLSLLAVSLAGCGSESAASSDKQTEHRSPGFAAAAGTVAGTATAARVADGKYISWREHLIDDVAIGGVEVAGSDGLSMADLDLDGYQDIVSVHESDTQYDGVPDGHIRIAYGTEDPDRWELQTLAEGAEAAAPEDVAIGDMNGDGYPDIVAACELAHLIYFENPGKQGRDERWKRQIPPSTLNRGSFIRVFLADFNKDGKLEVAATNKGAQSPKPGQAPSPISWFELRGDPLNRVSWVEHELIRIYWPINSQPVDLDGDGDLDILGGSQGEFVIFWFENTGEPETRFIHRPITISGFTPPKEERRASLPKDRAVVSAFNADFADLSGDGKLDIALVEGRVGPIWLEQPEDLSKPWQMHRIGTMSPDTATAVLLADLNGDGKVDLVSGGYSQSPRDRDGEDVTRDGSLGRLAWFEQPADARQPWERHDISRRKRGMFDKLIARDMNGDGSPDLVGTRGNSVPYDGVFWLEQVRSAKPGPAFLRAREQDSEEMPLPSGE